MGQIKRKFMNCILLSWRDHCFNKLLHAQRVDVQQMSLQLSVICESQRSCAWPTQPENRRSEAAPDGCIIAFSIVPYAGDSSSPSGERAKRNEPSAPGTRSQVINSKLLPVWEQ